jgi:hypothetical protein
VLAALADATAMTAGEIATATERGRATVKTTLSPLGIVSQRHPIGLGDQVDQRPD